MLRKVTTVGAAVLAAAAAFGPVGVPGAVLAQSNGQASVQAQRSDVVSESAVRVEFGNEIRFVLRARAEEPIRGVLFLYQVDGSTVQNTAVPAYQPGATVNASYAWRVANVLLPGTEIRYQWLIETASGRQITTPEQQVVYNDNRFDWREVRDGPLTVYFQEPDAGQALLTEARKLERQLASQFGLTLDKPLRIFAYTRQQDYLSALAAGRPQDVAVSVGADRIFVLAPAGTSGMTPAMKGLRREMATTVFVQNTQNPYAEAPRWLAEGFAFYAGGETVSAENYKALAQLAQNNQLLPLRTLNGNFPNSDRDRTLAYFESATAVMYVVDTYGPEKMRALLAAIKEGNTVDQALRKSLGVTLDQLESKWKAALKNGSIERNAARQQSARATAPQDQQAQQGRQDRRGEAAPAMPESGADGWIDRTFGSTIQFWQGSLGSYARPVVLGIAGLMGFGVVAVAGSMAFSIWRRGRDDD